MSKKKSAFERVQMSDLTEKQWHTCVQGTEGGNASEREETLRMLLGGLHPQRSFPKGQNNQSYGDFLIKPTI